MFLFSCRETPTDNKGPEHFHRIYLSWSIGVNSYFSEFSQTGIKRYWFLDDPLVLPADTSVNVDLGHLDIFSSPIFSNLIDENHQVFWIDSGCNLQFEDWWKYELPTGIKGRLHTDAPCVGVLTLVCLHQPNKSAPGVAEGDTTNAGGQLDYIATIDVIVE